MAGSHSHRNATTQMMAAAIVAEQIIERVTLEDAPRWRFEELCAAYGIPRTSLRRLVNAHVSTIARQCRRTDFPDEWWAHNVPTVDSFLKEMEDFAHGL